MAKASLIFPLSGSCGSPSIQKSRGIGITVVLLVFGSTDMIWIESAR